jgi:tetratricopeptide (TPR) repeat protein
MNPLKIHLIVVQISLKFCFLTLCAFCAGTLLCPPAHAQFWDKLTKPQITVNLTHPPRLGLNIKKVAFGPSNGQCSDEILDRLSGTLVSGGVEVMDRQNLQAVLAEQHLSLTGYVDQQSAVQMGKLLGPTALIFVKISRCSAEKRRNYSDSKTSKGGIVRTYNAIVEMHIRGSLQTIDLTTGRIFSASPIVEDSALKNHSTEGQPEFPSEEMVRDSAIGLAAYNASTMFVKWVERRQLYFFNDKDCNLARAFAMLKAGDIDGTVRQSEENVVACKSWPKVKDSNLAHAYYNAGLAYLLVNEHAKAMSYLTESEKLKGGDIVTQTIIQANKSARLEAEMQRVAEKTEKFEQAQANVKAVSQQAPSPGSASGPAGSKASSESVEERLKKLDALFKKGLITKEEFEAKKIEILKDI